MSRASGLAFAPLLRSMHRYESKSVVMAARAEARLERGTSGPRELPFSPEQRALLLPRRGELAPPKPVPLAKIWAEIHADYLRIERAWTNSRLPFAERLADEQPYKRKLDAPNEAACAIAFGVSDRDVAPVRAVTADHFVRYWAAKEGPAFAVETAICTMNSDRYAYRPKDGGTIQIRNRKSGNFQGYAVPGLWAAVRRWVVSLDEAAYAEALAAAERFQRKPYEGELENKLALSFAFPDEPTFANRAADAVLAAPSLPTFFGVGVGFLAATSCGPARLEKLIEDDAIDIPTVFLPELARCAGERTPRLLERAFEGSNIYGKRGPSVDDKRKDEAAIAQAVAETVALFATADAADVLARLADAPGTAAAISAYASAHPDLARAALERQAKKKKGKKGNGATKLLERLPSSPGARVEPKIAAARNARVPVRPLTAEERSTDDRVHWTAHARSLALLPERAPRTTPGWDAIDAPKYARKIREYLRGSKRLKQDVKKKTVAPELWPHVQGILAGEEENRGPDAAALVAVLGRFVGEVGEAFADPDLAMVSIWTAQHGIAFALEALVAWGRMIAEGDTFSGPITVRRQSFMESAWDAPRADVIQRLQLRLTQAPDDQHADALRKARALFASAEPTLKTILAFLFPDEKSFVPEPSDNDHYLLASSKDAELLTKLAAKELASPRWTDWPFAELAVFVPGHLVDVLGLRAAPLLQRMREQVGKLEDERYRGPLYAALDRGLAAIESRDAFRSSIAELGDWSRRPWVWSRLERRPALAVLAALDALDDPKTAAFAREVLGYVQHDHPDVAEALASKLTADEKAKLVAARSDSPLPPWLEATPSHWKPSKVPGFFSAHALPPIVLRIGGTLSAEQLERVRLVMTHGHAGPQIELSQLRAAATPESLSAFATALLQQWLDAKAPPKEKWALSAAAHLGGDRFATELVPLLRAWPGQGFHQRVELGLDALETIGSDLALMYLDAIARTSKQEAIATSARRRIDAIAARRGLTSDALADRLVPDLGLGATAVRRFDYGTRAFTARLDANVEPVLFDGDGRPIEELPKPRKDDDRVKAKEALAEYELFQRESKEIVKALRERFEGMMCSGGRLSREDFEAFFVRHPIVGQLARKVVWAEYVAGDPPITFRIAEDGTLAGLDDSKLELRDAPLGILHPVEVSADVVARWEKRMADYEIIQPIEQLARETARDAEQARETIRSITGRGIAIQKVRALHGRGWKKGPVEDHGFVRELRRTVGQTKLSLHLGGMGLPVGGGDGEPIEIDSIAPPADELTAIARSELVRDLRSMIV